MSGKSDTVKLMGYEADLGKLSSGIFDSHKQYGNSGNYYKLTSQKKFDGSGKGWCAGYGEGSVNKKKR